MNKEQRGKKKKKGTCFTPETSWDCKVSQVITRAVQCFSFANLPRFSRVISKCSPSNTCKWVECLLLKALRAMGRIWLIRGYLSSCWLLPCLVAYSEPFSLDCSLLLLIRVKRTPCSTVITRMRPFLDMFGRETTEKCCKHEKLVNYGVSSGFSFCTLRITRKKNRVDFRYCLNRFTSFIWGSLFSWISV